MKTYLPCLSVLACALALGAQAVTPAELQALLAAGERVALIDLRPQAAYEAGTLPDAMRMSAREAARKPLRGRVVFFDDGLGGAAAADAAVLLAEKNADVQADSLAGGFAAWSAMGGQTSERKGLRPAHQRYVTYQELAGDLADPSGTVVLLDVRPERKEAGMPAAAATGQAVAASESPVDLAAEFPRLAATRTLPRPADAPSTQRGPGRAAAAAPGTTPLYVLIDAGDGTAERTARRLRAAGVARVVILAGGESAIRRKGAPGLMRRGSGGGLDEERDGAPDFATIVQEEAKP